MPSRLVVLVSGEGTNLQALIEARADPDYGARVVAVGADRDRITALARAERAGRPRRPHQALPAPRARPDLASRVHEAGRPAVPGRLRRPLPEHPPGAATVVSGRARGARRAGPRGEGHRLHRPGR